jgi:phage shock protein A
MSEADELRQRAESLLTLALKAREQGQFELADSLLAEAAKFSNEAEALIAARERAAAPDSTPPSPGRK